MEAAALIWALETFRIYIDSVHVTIRTDHASLECIHSKTHRCKGLERWALRLQEFRFTIQPRPGTQQKDVDALSRPVGSDQQPIVLDEVPERVVLLMRSWNERVVALPAQGGPDKPERCGREHTPCTTVKRLAKKAHAQRRELRCQRGAARHVGHIQRASTQAHRESEDDGCQVVLTDAEESDEADGALVVPGREIDVAALGTSEGGVALSKVFPNADLIATQAKDPDCLRYVQLVNKPRAQWPPHLAAAPLQALYVAGARGCCACKSMMSFAWDPAMTTRKPDGVPDAGAFDRFLAAPASYYPQMFGNEPYTRTTSAITGVILGWPRHSRA